MLASINPLVERMRGNRFGLTAGSFAAGATAGGALAGAVAGLAGSALSWSDTGRGAAVVAAVAVAAVLDATNRVPTTKRQVDENWLQKYRGWVYGAGYGFQLGAGIVTVVTTAAVYAMFVAVAIAGSPVAGALVGGAFGLVRGLSLFAVKRRTDAAALRSFHRRVDALRAASMRATVAALLVLVAASAVVTAA